MGKQEDKQINRLKSVPSDYTYTEARSLLLHLGFFEGNKGKTSGSRVIFFRKTDGKKIFLHKPHPGDVMKKASVRDLLEFLKGTGDVRDE